MKPRRDFGHRSAGAGYDFAIEAGELPGSSNADLVVGQELLAHTSRMPVPERTLRGELARALVADHRVQRGHDADGLARCDWASVRSFTVMPSTHWVRNASRVFEESWDSRWRCPRGLVGV